MEKYTPQQKRFLAELEKNLRADKERMEKHGVEFDLSKHWDDMVKSLDEEKADTDNNK